MNAWGQPFFSDVLVGAYLCLLTLMWAALAWGVPGYGRKWRLHPWAGGQGERLDPLPIRVAVCIPARNEARNIGPCLQAVLASTHPHLEVILVDDRSEDDTAAVAAALAAGDERVRIVSGTEPPKGWAGKAWACSRAAGEAQSALLVFLDADVRIHPDTISRLVWEVESRGLDMASIFGSWDLRSFWERALIPTVGWLIRGAVDLDRVNDPSKPEAFANGQLIAIVAERYNAIGGHGAIRDQVLDDVRLAELAKRRALKIGMFVAPWMFRVRLYRSLGEIVRGYGKNLYEGMGRSPAIGFGAVLFILVGTLIPFLLLGLGIHARFILGWAVPNLVWLVWLILICGLQLVFRWRVERFDGRSGAAAWTHPLANVVLIFILFRAILGVRSTWKGRVFVDGRAP
jgi:glycosyltransferase involved in cell wall biosynthesis